MRSRDGQENFTVPIGCVRSCHRWLWNLKEACEVSYPDTERFRSRRPVPLAGNGKSCLLQCLQVTVNSPYGHVRFPGHFPDRHAITTGTESQKQRPLTKQRWCFAHNWSDGSCPGRSLDVNPLHRLCQRRDSHNSCMLLCILNSGAYQANARIVLLESASLSGRSALKSVRATNWRLARGAGWPDPDGIPKAFCLVQLMTGKPHVILGRKRVFQSGWVIDGSRGILTAKRLSTKAQDRAAHPGWPIWENPCTPRGVPQALPRGCCPLGRPWALELNAFSVEAMADKNREETPTDSWRACYSPICPRIGCRCEIKFRSPIKVAFQRFQFCVNLLQTRVVDGGKRLLAAIRRGRLR